MAFEPPPPPKAVFARLVPATAVGQELKAGFLFQLGDYPELKRLKNTFDTTMFVGPRSVSRTLKLTGAGTELHVGILVNSKSIQLARDEVIDSILSTSMLPADVYSSGPTGFGDFSIGYGTEVAASKIETLLCFMRANVGITLWRPRGTLSIVDLARRIDKNLVGVEAVKNLDPLCPRGLQGKLSRQEVQVGESLEFTATFDRREGVTYEIFVLTDNRLLKEQSRNDGHASWLALAPGVAPVQATVCDSKLLSSTMETAAKILENE